MAEFQDNRDAEFALGRVPGRFQVSSQFMPSEGSVTEPQISRFAYQVFDSNEEVAFESDSGWEIILRETPTRQQLKALFFEDTRQIQRLAFQRFKHDGTRLRRESFLLSGGEVASLMSFLALIRSSALDLAEHPDGIRLLPDNIDALLSDESSRVEVFKRYRGLFTELFQGDVDSPEIVALARRRRQLETFRELLYDPEAFEERRQSLREAGRKSGPEDVWQEFFESNRWIFGSGLATQFLHAWSPDRLEQTTVGASVFGAGKRPDAVMRTAGALSALALVEIKAHNTPLLDPKPYRAGAWKVAQHVAGGVAQCQTTVDETVRVAERELVSRDAGGFPTERTLVCRPRSVLVVGSLDQFVQEGQTSIPMFESFERFRRSITDPEIVTFDELYERARMVLDMADVRESVAPAGTGYDEPLAQDLPPMEAPF